MLGLASATRFYFVTWLGERVVADIRKAVFDNVLGLTPAFFEVTRTGEVLSRLTADTTLIQTVVGSSVSLALRNLVTLTGGLVLMFVTSLKLALLVVGGGGAGHAADAAVRPLGANACRARARIPSPKPPRAARETLNAVSTVQAFTQEDYRAPRISAQRWSAPSPLPRAAPVARAILTAVAIFTVFASLATVVLVGLQDIIGQRMTRRPAGAVHLLWRAWWPAAWARCRKSGAICSARRAPPNG